MSKLFFPILLSLCLVLLVQAGKRSSKESKKEKHNKASNLKNQSDYYCYDDIDHPYVFFATKTSYRWNRNKNDDEITPPGKFCHLFLVICNNAIDGTEKNLLPNFLP
jgi:hypothetical protein